MAEIQTEPLIIGPAQRGPASNRRFGVALVVAASLAGAPARAEEAFITDQKADMVSVIDLAAGHIEASIAVDGHPAGIAVSRDGRQAFVTSPDGHRLSFIDTRMRRITRRVTLPGGPLGVAVSPDGATVYVADWYGDQVFAVDVASGAVAPPIQVGHSPSGLVVTPDGAMLVCADRLDDELSLVDLATRRQVAVVKVGAHPFGVTLDATGAGAYAADVESDDVAVVDLAARRLLARIPTGHRPYVVALAGQRGFVTNELVGTLTAFDLTTLLPLATIRVGDFPEGIQASADGKHLYVANWMDDTLSVVDAERMVVTGEMEAGDSPRAFGTFLIPAMQGTH